MKRWQWIIICFALMYAGAWLDDHYHNHWFALISAAAVVPPAIDRIREERRRKALDRKDPT